MMCALDSGVGRFDELTKNHSSVTSEKLYLAMSIHQSRKYPRLVNLKQRTSKEIKAVTGIQR